MQRDHSTCSPSSDEGILKLQWNGQIDAQTVKPNQSETSSQSLRCLIRGEIQLGASIGR